MTDVATRTSVDPTVIAGIAAIAATQVPGVRLHVAQTPPDRSEPAGRPAVRTRPGLPGSLRLAADPEPPVRSWCEEPGTVGVAVVVEVALDPDRTVSVPAAAEAVRREVAAAMTAMTRLRVTRCDVHVADVFVPETPPAADGGAPAATELASVGLVDTSRLVALASRSVVAMTPVPDAVEDRLPGAPEPAQVPRPRTGEPGSRAADTAAAEVVAAPVPAPPTAAAEEASHHG
ncbi:hypothetical protein GCM10027596_03730 [Nocardioides korecus]